MCYAQLVVSRLTAYPSTPAPPARAGGPPQDRGLGRGGRSRHGYPLAGIGEVSKKLPIPALPLRPRGLGDPPRIEGWVEEVAAATATP
jgi:hypothetical protein